MDINSLNNLNKGNYLTFNASAFTESLQLSNLKIYVYDLPSIFNYDQLKINALHPPKIWDPKCKENFYSAKCSLHVYG